MSFESFILAGEPLAKALLICVLVNCNLCGKLFASLEFPTTFDEIFKVTLVPFFSTDFNLLSCELNNFYIRAKIKFEYFYSSLRKI